MTSRSQFLRQLAAETKYAHAASHGFLCAARLKTLLDALGLEARAHERRRVALASLALCGLLAVLSGAALSALMLI